MSSYLLIDLDTTKPEVSIYAPRYTTEDISNTITIEANESLSAYQDIYVVDSEGRRHNYTFEKESDNIFIGKIRFNNLPLGIATIYARVTDEVDNVSDLALSTIEIKKAITLLSLEIADFSKDVYLSKPISVADIDIADRATVIESSLLSNDIEVSIINNNLNTRDYDSLEKDEVFG